MKEAEHEDTPDSDDRIDFTGTPQPKAVAPIPVGAEPRPMVGVREPRRPLPLQLARAASKPIPGQLAGAPGIPTKPSVVPGKPDIVSTPVEAPQRVELGRIRSGGANITVRRIMQEAEASVGAVPKGAKFTEEDIGFLKQEQIGDLTSKNESQGTRASALQTQMAEEVSAEAIAPAASAQIDVLREMVNRPPAELIAIPLLAEAFKAMRQAFAKRARPGVVGRPGPADPVRPKSTFRPSEAPGIRSPSHAPRSPRGGPALQFNAAERMRVMMGASRRSVREFRGETPEG